MPSTI